jgi:short-subunit dehydrogenase
VRTAGADLRALVTGASSGIGAAFVRALHARGERLVMVARRADRLEQLASAVGGKDACLVVPLDLARAGASDELAERLAAEGITVDLLVNNAGVGQTGRFHEQTADAALGMVDLNVRALVALTRAFLPGMVARGRGRIINVVSTSALQPVPYLAVYAASKAFVLSFTESLEVELAGTGVRVQSLIPGLTATEFQQVAGTDAVPFNKTAAMTPEAVVRASLEALDAGRARVIPGWQNRLTAGVQSFLPRSLVRRVAGHLFRPKH